MHLKQSTAVVVQFGPFVDATDGVSLETGLVTALDHASTGIKLAKNGGTLTIRHASVTASTYDAHGCYKVTLDTTDTNTLGTLRMIYTDATTCLPVWQDFMVLPANVWDALYGSDNLQVDLIQIDGALTSGNNATLNLKQLNIVNSTGSAVIASAAGSNGHGIAASGNGSGTGLRATGGATGEGLYAIGGATSGHGFRGQATTSGAGLYAQGAGVYSGILSAGGATGPGMALVGGATSGDGLLTQTTLGHGVNLTATGTDKHGLLTTGGNGGTSDGLKAVAGTGGVPIRGDITGNITGTLATLTTYTGNTPQTGDTYALANGTSGFVALKTLIDALTTTIGAAGAGLTATATAVWAVATRLLTAGTNIVLTKGVGVTGFTDLDAAGVRTAVGLASANLDTQLSTIDDFLDTEVAAIKAKTDNLPSSPAAVGSAMTLTSGERNSVADALLDRTDGVETSTTVRQSLRLSNAANAGKTDGMATTTAHLRDLADTKNRVTATVDSDGNRTSVTRDLT